MAWAPNATVTIGGTVYTSSALNGVSINYGRSNVWEQPRAGYAQIEILNVSDVNNGFEIGQSVVITVQNSTAVVKTVFTGVLTDVNNRIGNTGSSGETTIQTITAVAPMAKMARTLIGDAGYASQTDTDRMTSILTDAGVTIDVVDSPFIYTFAARAAGVGDSYSIAASYATQGFGYIYETTDGKVGYANEAHRLNDVQTNGYYNIPENNILWNGVQSQRSRNDIINNLTLTYDPALSVTSADATSSTLFGVSSAKIDTEISTVADAQIIADRYVAIRAVPQNNLSAFTVMLDSPNVSNATIDKLVTCYMGLPIQVQNLPLAISSTTYKGFVEGWTLRIGRVQASLTLKTTDATFSLTPTRWQDVDPTTAWNAVDATVQWYAYE
jgi:hypothetical protein